MPTTPLLRTRTANHSILKSCNGGRETAWTIPSDNLSVLEIQRYHDPSSLDVEAKKQLVPPYHWHWYQEEYFIVTQGRFIFRLDGQEVVVTATDPSPKIAISAGARHTFQPDPSLNTPCVVEISASASPASLSVATITDYGTNERFYRNLYSYLEDCRCQQQEPSLPQLLMFLDSAEVSMAWDYGPPWAMRWMSWALGVVVGRWWGGYVLGLKDSYPEYYNPQGIEGKKEM